MSVRTRSDIIFQNDLHGRRERENEYVDRYIVRGERDRYIVGFVLGRCSKSNSGLPIAKQSLSSLDYFFFME